MVRKYGGEELVKRAELALKSCKDAATHKRAMSVILTVKENKSPDEAAKTLGVCVSTLIKYRREFIILVRTERSFFNCIGLRLP